MWSLLFISVGLTKYFSSGCMGIVRIGLYVVYDFWNELGYNSLRKKISSISTR